MSVSTQFFLGIFLLFFVKDISKIGCLFYFISIQEHGNLYKQNRVRFFNGGIKTKNKNEKVKHFIG
jgi:hypothetical protein